MSMEIADHDTALNNAIGTKLQRAANHGLAAPAASSSEIGMRHPFSQPASAWVSPPLPHQHPHSLFWLASHRDRTTLLALSRVSKFFHEVCKPLVPPALTLSEQHTSQFMELDTKHWDTASVISSSLIYLTWGIFVRATIFESAPHVEREVCDRKHRPQPPPPGYLLNYPIDLLTRIFELACVGDPAIGRSLCLASKGFYAVVKPVMLYRVELRKPSQILRLAHLVSVDATARAGIRHLTIDIPKLGEALLHEEPDWGEKDEIGKFRWDSGYWGDPDVKYIDDSKSPEELGSLDKPENRDESKSLGESESSDESEDSSDSGEEMDIKQDMDFLASSEGQLFGNLAYGPDGELTEGGRWPWDIGLEKARALVDNATPDILHAVAPILRNLELISWIRN
ncbi:hypothetical protein BD779DRAFT_1804032 [Infundibulicybe gibba]|nr:hypothetical protein BD779DRAFT_1804032 [Infundibulicybe gibba]